MKKKQHGADIYTAARKLGISENKIIDFSSNINPLGIPKGVQRAAIDSIKYSNRYPDINCRELVNSISIYENIPVEWIFTSNGAAEAIYRIALNFIPHNGFLLAPTFSEYEQALKTVGTNIKYFNLIEEDDFKVTDKILNSINDEVDIVFICNPNNPTGQITDKKLLETIISHSKSIGVVVVIDECFLDFVEDKEKYSVSNILKKYDNLIILKAFTKTYAIPGLRLGYCLSSNTEIIRGLKNSGPPWNVSTIAQASGLAALKERDYLAKSIIYVTEQRKYLANEMKNLNIKVYESYANYILFKIIEKIDLKEEMLKRGILIRSCSNYMNLDYHYYRIAVKSKDENKLFIKKLKEIIRAK
ncbi:threonine-phosphate decarboxylase CobD [Sedimentibacter sp. MB31-C6]|uniref:threonine-phosphate decarboxylase CobD n=1 Tax=Sedimentibacter sp. MB31-C6 TaxID=3109366 RepID=UPI002DDCBFB3|nr:threonine-phosphate decarboxylase CobD [Sedimentibacter sp. MB36-C1]WSI04518.1 threonine-phosphate decarboxylase CobD [Sedimentibacter sp. MB36-C1]